MFTHARYNELFEAVMKYEQSPGPGSYGLDLPYNDALSLQAGSVGRYTVLSPEEQHDKRSPEIQVNLGPAQIETTLKGPVPTSNSMVRATTKYSQGMYYHIPNDLSIFSPSQVPPPLPEHKQQEANFLGFAAAQFGHFTLVNPSIFALSVMAKIWNDITICVPPKWEQDYSEKIKEIMDTRTARIHIVNSVRGRAYLGSSGKTLTTGDWFSLQLSPFASTVTSRAMLPDRIEYAYPKKHKNVSQTFNFVESNFRSHLSALKGFPHSSDFFVLSSTPLSTVPYSGTNLIGYTLAPVSASNSVIMASVQRYGPNALNLEANISVPSPLFEVRGYAVNYGEDSTLVYGPPRNPTGYKKISLFLDEFKWTKALIRAGSVEPHTIHVDPAYKGIWLHTFVYKSSHSPSLFHRNFGKIINRANSSFVDKGASYGAGVRYDDTRLLERVSQHPVSTSDVLYLDAAPLLDSGDVFIRGSDLVSREEIRASSVHYRDQVPPVTRPLATALRCRPGKPQLVWLEDWTSVDAFVDNGFEVHEVWPCSKQSEYRIADDGTFPVVVSWVRIYRVPWRDPHMAISCHDAIKGGI